MDPESSVSICGGRTGGCGVSANEYRYSCAHEAHINFRDLTTYLTYGPYQRGLKYTEHKPFGRQYLGVTHTTVSSAVKTLT